MLPAQSARTLAPPATAGDATATETVAALIGNLSTHIPQVSC